MSIKEIIKDASGVLKQPNFIILYTAVKSLFEYLTGTNTLLSIPVIVLLDPIIFSYIISYFFIEAIDSSKLSVHKRIALGHYFPFLKIEIIFFLFSLLLSLINFLFLANLFRVKNNDLSLAVSADLIYIFYMFWMCLCVFEKNKIWASFKKSAKLISTIPVFFLLSFGVFLVVSITENKLGFIHGLTKNNILSAIPFIFLSSILKLAIYKIIVLNIARRRNPLEMQAILNEYLAGDNVSLGVSHDEKREVKSANKCFILGLLSFIPFVHLFATCLGLKRFLKQQFGRVRAISGFISGVFFTLIYMLVIIGIVTGPKKAELLYARTIEKYLTAESTPQQLKGVLKSLKEKNYYAVIDVLKKNKSGESEAECFALGLAYEKTGYIKEAIEAFTRCSRITSHNGEALFHLGVLSLEIHDNDKAKNYFREFIRRYPGDREAQRYIELIENSVNWQEDVITKILAVIVILISMSLHEYAHAYTAYRCGDAAQKDYGRLTLNPIRHLDLFGSIILPGILIFNKSSVVFGWARPVMVNKESLKNPERDYSLVSLMGSSTNILVALIATSLLAIIGLLVSRIFPEVRTLHYFYPFVNTSVTGIPFAKIWTYVNIFLMQLVAINITLGIFNLMPIPPLDGSWLFPRMLPSGLRAKYEAFRKYALIFIIILLFTHIIDFVIVVPLQFYFSFLNLTIAAALGLG